MATPMVVLEESRKCRDHSSRIEYPMSSSELTGMAICERKAAGDDFVLADANADNIGCGIESRKIGFGLGDFGPPIAATGEEECSCDECNEAAPEHLTMFRRTFATRGEHFFVYCSNLRYPVNPKFAVIATGYFHSQ